MLLWHDAVRDVQDAVVPELVWFNQLTERANESFSSTLSSPQGRNDILFRMVSYKQIHKFVVSRGQIDYNNVPQAMPRFTDVLKTNLPKENGFY